MTMQISLNDDGSPVTGAQLFYEILDSFNIRDVTGYSGGNVLPLIDAFANPSCSKDGVPSAPIHVHMHANEACAGHSATAIARSTNHVGVCIVTSGPGITNCVTPLKDAYADGAALLMISGQVAQPVMGKEAFQEVDAVGVTTPVTKWSHLVTRIEKLPWTINRAFKKMLNERPGPVHLDVPKDIFNAPVPLEFDPFANKRANGPRLDNPLICSNARSYVDMAMSTKVVTDDGIQYLSASREHCRSDHDIALTPSLTGAGSVVDLTKSFLVSPNSGRSRDSCNTPEPERVSYGCPDIPDIPKTSSQLLDDLINSGSPGSGFTDLPSIALYNTNHHSVTDDSLIGCAPDIAYNIPKLMKLISVAKKPLIHVGNGASSASPIIRQLIKKLQIPATCTMHGMGVISAHDPLFISWIGMHGSIAANKAIMTADLIVNFGARFDDRSIGSPETFGESARQAAMELRGGIVHIDISGDAFGKSGVIPHLTLRADCGVVASKLLQQSDEMNHDDWIDQVMSWKKQYPMTLPESPEGVVYGPHIVDSVNRWALQNEAHKNILVTTGVGNHQMYACQYFDYTHPRQLVSSGGLGTMGVGLPFAIGMSIANPHHHIINFDGDGSFNMSYNDLSTLMRFKDRKIRIFIFNDSHLSMVAMWQEFFMCDRKFITQNTNPDYVKLAEAHGIKSVVVDSLHTIDQQVDEAMSFDGPVIVDCRVLAGHVFPMAIPGTSLNLQYHDLQHMRATVGAAGMNVPSPG